ncbi:hypothetical protein GCM10009687_77410 [Asanoa iriomotensis]|uniref:Uncharacterized protein n=1 Tax=Asanoa iriomotensis TaxID=234613 RepID=A0ABQ4CE06_9ACTN|nr:hypothetical protein Air01nite_70880 [Asanoa iriomotensis]
MGGSSLHLAFKVTTLGGRPRAWRCRAWLDERVSRCGRRRGDEEDGWQERPGSPEAPCRTIAGSTVRRR